MRTRNANLKARIFAQSVGFIYVVAFILVTGNHEGAFAAEADLRSNLELKINERMNTEIEALNEQLIHRMAEHIARNAPSGEDAQSWRY